MLLCLMKINILNIHFNIDANHTLNMHTFLDVCVYFSVFIIRNTNRGIWNGLQDISKLVHSYIQVT